MKSFLKARTVLSLGLWLAALVFTPQALFGRKEHSMIKVTSPAFEQGHSIPAKYACEGEDVSPPLHWENVPADAKSIALVVEDPDAPRGTFTHWLMWGLPGTTRDLPENLPKTETLSNGGKQGMTDFQHVGYGGPCPPSGKPHHYIFRVYALDSTLKLKPGASKNDLLSAMDGHVLAEGQLVGTYKRK